MNLERLSQIAQQEDITRFLRLTNITFEQYINATFTDYRNVEIADGSVVYCDIPYRGTNIYAKDRSRGVDANFYDDFYRWCRQQKQLVIISEYAMPDDFVCVAEIAHVSTLCATKVNAVTERLFVPRHQEHLYREMMNQGTLFSGL